MLARRNYTAKIAKAGFTEHFEALARDEKSRPNLEKRAREEEEEEELNESASSSRIQPSQPNIASNLNYANGFDFGLNDSQFTLPVNTQDLSNYTFAGDANFTKSGSQEPIQAPFAGPSPAGLPTMDSLFAQNLSTGFDSSLPWTPWSQAYQTPGYEQDFSWTQTPLDPQFFGAMAFDYTTKPFR